MFERLEVANYQSLQDVDLSLGRFTVIVGPSGRGKSALLRALRALCFNQVGQDFVRQGQQKAAVTLTFDDGRVLVWEKARDKGATYELDGDLFTRTNRDVPDDVAKALGIRRIEVDKGVTFAPQFQSQHDAPLLLAESSTVAARALAKLTKLSAIVEAQVDCRRDQKRAARTSEASQEEATRLREQIRKMPNSQRAGKVLVRAEKRIKEVAEDVRTAHQAESIVHDMAGSLLLSDMVLPTEAEFETAAEAVALAERAALAVTGRASRAEAAENAHTTLQTAEGRVETVQHEHDALIAELGACPLCGSTETWGR